MTEKVNKQKVLLVHNYYKIPGGEDTVVANEKKLLEENGHEVVLYTRDNREIERFSVIGKMLLPVRAVFNRKTYRDVIRIIREQHIDVVHVHNTLTLISPSVYYAALKCKIPVVQTVHNFRLICPAATLYRDGHICEDCLSKGLRCAVKHNCYRGSKLQTILSVAILKYHRMRGIYKRISYICLTEFNKTLLAQHAPVCADRIYVKPNFTFDEGGGKIVPFRERDRQFVFVGRLDRLKGIDKILKVWKELGDKAPNLIVCGTGPMEEWCRAFVTENELKNVELRGQVDHAAAVELMARSLAVVFPTQWYEGFPMTIAEAYSVGTPVIGPDMGNAGDLIEDGVTGWKYAPSSMQAFKAAMEKAQQQDICMQTYERYLGSYSDRSNYTKLSEIYRFAEGVR